MTPARLARRTAHREAELLDDLKVGESHIVIGHAPTLLARASPQAADTTVAEPKTVSLS